MYNKMSQYDTTCSTVVPGDTTCFSTVPGVVKNLTVTALSANLLRVSWEPPLSPNGVLTGYQVVVVSLLNSSKLLSLMSPDVFLIADSEMLSHNLSNASGEAISECYLFLFSIY